MEMKQSPEAETGQEASAPLDSSLVTSILKGEPTSAPLPQEHLPTTPLPQSPASAGLEDAASQTTATSKRVPPPLTIPNRTKSKSVSVLGPTSHRRGSVSVSQAANRLSLTIPAEDVDLSGSDVDFLTVLASQERRVLELREQLHKAEEHLLVLKKKWTAQEASKLNKPIQRMQTMRPATAGGSPRLSALEDEDGSTNWMYQEMQRRKTIMSKSTRQGHRRIFSGSREVMPLTLVSPRSKRLSAPPMSNNNSSSSNDDQERRDSETVSDSNTWSGSRLARSSTMPDFGEPIPEEASERGVSIDGSRSHHVRKSTQIVSDFREGLWTFFEDLRQATVGDDARPTKPLTRPPHERSQSLLAQSKRRHSPQAKRKGQRRSGGDPQHQPHEDATLIDIGGAFWKEQGLERMGSHHERTPRRSTSGQARRKSRAPREVALHTQLYDGETWDTWDTPQKSSPSGAPSSSMSSPAQHSHSTRDGSTRNSSQSSVEAMPTPSKPATTPQQEIETNGTTAWPAFSKRASMLRSSAMQLMDDWERSLNPPESHQEVSPDPAHIG